MTEHLASLLTAKVKQFDELACDEVDTRGRDVGFVLYTVMNMMCTLEIDLTEPGETPEVVVHCDVVPGGRVGEVWIEARDGEASIRRYIEADSGLHRATQNWFTDAWDSWDEILEDDADGEQLGLHVADLQPGDLIWRLDLVVASVESAGVDSTGAQLLAVYFDANPGREIWRADRVLTVIRGGYPRHPGHSAAGLRGKDRTGARPG